jgi:phosphoglycerate kinase
MKFLIDANIQNGTRVFVRCDLDVPIEDGKILDTFRLEAALPTLKYIIEKGAFPVIAGHIGKPNGKEVPELSTSFLKPYFDEKLSKDKYELLENLRFDPREKNNDENYAKELSSKADIYVNESFATCHREHASIIGIPKFIPGYAGLRLQKEVSTLQNILKEPEKPFVVIIGGAKLESKMPVVSKFLSIADYVLIGGRLGLEWEDDIPDNLIIPSDYAKDEKDIGPKSIQDFVIYIQMAKTILWAGPMGAYEETEYSVGTDHIAKAVLDETSHKGTYSFIGGGDTIAAAQKILDINKFSFVSTGGGAMLNFVAKGTLPGTEALK